MKHINTMFHQLLKFVPRKQFDAVVKRYHGDRRVRSLSCWKQLSILLFAQFSGCQSLRDVLQHGIAMPVGEFRGHIWSVPRCKEKV